MLYQTCLFFFAVDNEPMEKVRGFKLLKNHIKAMFLKLAYNSMRNKLTALIQFVTPIINITISVIISRSWKFLSQLPPLTLSLESGFRATQTLLSQNNVTDGSIEAMTMNAYKNYFKTSTYPNMKLTDIGTLDLGKYYLKLVSIIISASILLLLSLYTMSLLGKGLPFLLRFIFISYN